MHVLHFTIGIYKKLNEVKVLQMLNYQHFKSLNLFLFFIFMLICTCDCCSSESSDPSGMALRRISLAFMPAARFLTAFTFFLTWKCTNINIYHNAFSWQLIPFCNSACKASLRKSISWYSLRITLCPSSLSSCFWSHRCTCLWGPCAE